MSQRESTETQPLLNGVRTRRTSSDSSSFGSPVIDRSSPQKAQKRRQVGPMDVPSRQRTAILCGLWMATFLSALNTTMVATLVSSIASEFNSAQQASWLGTSFLLATCTFTPLYGRLSNAAGRRTASQIAILSCAIGTIACGMSTRLDFLILSRFVAGIGGGGIFTTASICVSDLYSMRDRSLTQGYSSVFVGLGQGLGGPLGGYISDRLGWRWAFILQAPVFAISFTLVTLNLNYATPGRSKSPKEVLKRIDYFGCVTLLCAVASYLVFLSLKYNEDLRWQHPGVIASIVLTIVFSFAFVLVELLVAAEPILAPTLLRQKTPVLVGLSNMLVSITNFSVQYYVPMWFETVQTTTVTIAGLHIMPNSMSMSLGSLFAGFMMHRTGKYKKLNTTFGILPGIAALALARLQTDSWTFTQWISIIPLGFGNAVVLQTTLIALLASIPHSMLAVGTGFTQLFRGIGQVSGVAVSSAVFQHLLERELEKRIVGAGSADLIRKIRHSSRFVATLPEDTQVHAREAYAIGLQRVFLFTASMAFVGWCLRLAIPELSLDNPRDDQEYSPNIAHSTVKPDEELDRGLHDVDDESVFIDDGDEEDSAHLTVPAGRKPAVRRLSTYEADDGFDPEIMGGSPRKKR